MDAQSAPTADEIGVDAHDEVDTAGHTRGHAWLMWTLVTVASVLVVLGALGVWVKRVALDTPTWADTSARVLQNPTVQRTLSSYLVDQLFDNVDVAAELQQRLPAQARGLAAPAAAGLRELA